MPCSGVKTLSGFPLTPSPTVGSAWCSRVRSHPRLSLLWLYVDAPTLVPVNQSSAVCLWWVLCWFFFCLLTLLHKVLDLQVVRFLEKVEAQMQCFQEVTFYCPLVVKYCACHLISKAWCFQALLLYVIHLLILFFKNHLGLKMLPNKKTFRKKFLTGTV